MSRTVSGSSEQRLGVPTFPLVEKARSDGTEVTMQPSHLRAKIGNIGKLLFLVAHHSSGFVSGLEVAASLQ